MSFPNRIPSATVPRHLAQLLVLLAGALGVVVLWASAAGAHTGIEAGGTAEGVATTATQLDATGMTDAVLRPPAPAEAEVTGEGTAASGPDTAGTAPAVSAGSQPVAAATPSGTEGGTAVADATAPSPSGQAGEGTAAEPTPAGEATPPEGGSAAPDPEASPQPAPATDGTGSTGAEPTTSSDGTGPDGTGPAEGGSTTDGSPATDGSALGDHPGTVGEVDGGDVTSGTSRTEPTGPRAGTSAGQELPATGVGPVDGRPGPLDGTVTALGPAPAVVVPAALVPVLDQPLIDGPAPTMAPVPEPATATPAGNASLDPATGTVADQDESTDTAPARRTAQLAPTSTPTPAHQSPTAADQPSPRSSSPDRGERPDAPTRPAHAPVPRLPERGSSPFGGLGSLFSGGGGSSGGSTIDVQHLYALTAAGIALMLARGLAANHTASWKSLVVTTCAERPG